MENLVSPKGKVQLEYQQFSSVLPKDCGPHLTGDCYVYGKGINIKIRHIGYPAVWSTNGNYLAVPKWTKRIKQLLVILDLHQKEFRCSKKEFDVLTLKSFHKNCIKGIEEEFDSGNSRKIILDINTLDYKIEKIRPGGNF